MNEKLPEKVPENHTKKLIFSVYAVLDETGAMKGYFVKTNVSIDLIQKIYPLLAGVFEKINPEKMNQVIQVDNPYVEKG